MYRAENQSRVMTKPRYTRHLGRTIITLLKTLQLRRLLQGQIKPREIELSSDISTGQYQSSSGLLRYHEFTEIYIK